MACNLADSNAKAAGYVWALLLALIYEVLVAISLIAVWAYRAVSRSLDQCRGVCPSCTTGRMVETAAHLADHVIPRLAGAPVGALGAQAAALVTWRAIPQGSSPPRNSS